MKLPEYKTLAEKDAFFNCVNINIRADFDKYYKTLSMTDGVVYRGVYEAKFHIYTSAQRAWQTDSLGYHTTFCDFIRSLLSKLKSDQTIIDYLKSTDVSYNDVLGLAMLQHFGAPSTLIDFSLDQKSALFFAFDGMKIGCTDNEIDDYVSLYVVENDKLKYSYLPNLTDVLAHGMDSGVKMLEEHFTQMPQDNIDDSLLRDLDKFACWHNPRNPGGGLSEFSVPTYIGNPLYEKSFSTYGSNQKFYWSNINLIAQKGCFILNNHESQPLEEYMASKNYKIKCYNIHKSLAEYIKSVIKLGKEDIYPDLSKRIPAIYTDYLRTKI